MAGKVKEEWQLITGIDCNSGTEASKIGIGMPPKRKEVHCQYGNHQQAAACSRKDP
jgi:hypothetical protein